MATVSDALSDVDFGDFIDALWDGGWYQYVFPFLLVYAVVFTILNYIELFEDKKPVRVIIALVFALFAIAFPITGDGDCVGRGCGETLGDLMMALFPGVSAFVVAILALYIIAGMLGVDLADFLGTGEKPNVISYVLIGLGVLVVIYYFAMGFGWGGFGDSGGIWGDIEDFFSDPFLYIIILAGLFFWWISRDELTQEQKDARRAQRREDRENLRKLRMEEQDRRRNRRGA